MTNPTPLTQAQLDHEADRVKFIRDYFERGCICIHDGTLETKSADVPDQEAAVFYEQNCKCSRNY